VQHNTAAVAAAAAGVFKASALFHVRAAADAESQR